ncbi:hypothetical protein [Janthinobacterium lividum]|uniref:hypothetical protein n=1 Tax=Janthinobacterium lividum TaxID=29581 RepID=UPI001268F38B|nr:hypothetical protein [Janthinobacterium lividum]
MATKEQVAAFSLKFDLGLLRMVGIVQPDSFRHFLRKVGYSVGLENTLSRFTDFCELYSSTPQLKNSDWQTLVHEKWGLKTKNIADVFASLGIAQITTQGVFAGPFGEAGAICIRLLEKREEVELALRHLFGLSVLLADGDIFFNCLASEFKPDRIATRLKGMVLGKRQELFDIFKGQADREAIASAITIERQRSNKGGAVKGSRLTMAASKGLAGISKNLGLPTAKDVNRMDPPSDDYFRHIVPSRREWAKSLGFCDGDGRISPAGWRILHCLGKGGFVFPGGEYSLRPTKFELECNRLSAIPELTESAPRTWDYVFLVANGLSVEDLKLSTEIDGKALELQTVAFFKIFRELSQDRRLVRKELPLFVALSSYMAISRARGEDLVDYDAWLRDYVPSGPGIKVRSSRTIEIGILISNDGRN